MSFRAIFFDIDGTLLGRDKRMPPSTLHALKKAREWRFVIRCNGPCDANDVFPA